MKTILLIEDYTPIRENIVELLEMEGYHVMTASDGKVGLELAMSELPSLILCDIQLPELNGYQVLVKLRENPSTSKTPFVCVTANCEKIEEKRAMDLGADGYLRKPFHDNQLFEILAQFLGKKKSELS